MMVLCNWDSFPGKEVVSPTDDQYEVLSDLPEDAVVFYWRHCWDRGQQRGEEEGDTGEGVMVTWRDAVDKFMKESFLKVSNWSSGCHDNTCIRVRILASW